MAQRAAKRYPPYRTQAQRAAKRYPPYRIQPRRASKRYPRIPNPASTSLQSLSSKPENGSIADCDDSSDSALATPAQETKKRHRLYRRCLHNQNDLQLTQIAYHPITVSHEPEKPAPSQTRCARQSNHASYRHAGRAKYPSSLSQAPDQSRWDWSPKTQRH